MGITKYLRQAWAQPDVQAQRTRYITWRKEPTFVRLDNPTRVDRARSLGYKAKDGFVVVRTKIGKGQRKRPKRPAGYKPSNMGRFVSPKKSLQSICEERVAKKYLNLEVLNSYWVGDDSKTEWYEIILVNPNHPQIKADKTLNWISQKQHTRRVHRGLTSAGKKGRGLLNKGKGAEKLRPSIRANKGNGK